MDGEEDRLRWVRLLSQNVEIAIAPRRNTLGVGAPKMYLNPRWKICSADTLASTSGILCLSGIGETGKPIGVQSGPTRTSTPSTVTSFSCQAHRVGRLLWSS